MSNSTIGRPSALRGAAAAAALAAAALAWGGGERAPYRVAAVDESRSVPRGGPFAADASEADAVLRFAAAVAEGDGEPDPAGTDLAAALRAALARIPQGRGGEILLRTDGRATTGDLAAALGEVRRRGVALRAVAIPGTVPPRVARLDAPATARPGDRLPLAVEVTGGSGTGGIVRLEDEAAGEAEERAFAIPEGGRARVVFARTAGGAGVRRYRASCRGPLAGAVAEAAVLVEGEASVLRLGRVPAGGGVSALLRETAGGRFEDAAGPAAVAAALGRADLAATALLVLDDLPERALPPGAGERIREAVRGGLGLLVLGGPSTLGPGGFAGRPLEEALPVRCAPERPRPLLVLALDVSGSMEEEAPGGGTRAAAVRAAAGALVDGTARDARLALVFFDDGRRGEGATFDLADAEERGRAREAATAVRAPGGGTRFAAAVEGALAAAARSPGPGARTLLLVTDGHPSEDAAALGDLGRSLRDARFSLRVIPVSAAPDAARLAAFAEAAGGKVAAPSAGGSASAALAEVLLEGAAAPDADLWKAAPSAVRAGPDASPFGRVPAGLPDAPGHDRVFPREEAATWLLLEDGDPLLVAGNRGLGRAVVFASPPEAGGAAWASGPAASLLAAAARWANRPPESPEAEGRARTLPDGSVEVQLRTLPGAAPRGPVRASGTALRRTGPSSWAGTVPAAAVPAGGVIVFDGGGRVMARAATARAPWPEDAAVGPDGEALAALEVAGDPSRGRRSGAGPAAVAAGLLALALLLAAGIREGRSLSPPPAVG